MKVALFGGTGFVGSYIVDALLEAGHEPVQLVRSGSEDKVRQPDRCRTVTGDVGDGEAVAKALDGCDAAIYVVGILREDPDAGITFEAMQHEGAKRAIDAAKDRGVSRFILMSANGAAPDGTDYQRTKYRAEQYLLESGLDGTVFRPSIIFGDPRGLVEFCTQLKQQMIAPPIPAPAFFQGLPPATGGFSMTPVHVEDVARAVVMSLDRPETFGQVYPLGGAETLEWPEIIRRIAKGAGRSKLILPAPAAFVRLACLALDRFRWFPMTRDQLDMLLEGNEVESREAFELFGIEERGMTPEELAYLRS